jgi:hypothetical protein
MVKTASCAVHSPSPAPRSCLKWQPGFHFLYFKQTFPFPCSVIFFFFLSYGRWTESPYLVMERDLNRGEKHCQLPDSSFRCGRVEAGRGEQRLLLIQVSRASWKTWVPLHTLTLFKLISGYKKRLSLFLLFPNPCMVQGFKHSTDVLQNVVICKGRACSLVIRPTTAKLFPRLPWCPPVGKCGPWDTGGWNECPRRGADAKSWETLCPDILKQQVLGQV